MSVRADLNTYLACEFGLDDAGVSDTSPFELEERGEVLGEPVFVFSDDGAHYYAWGGSCLRFLPVAGMSLADLERQEAGSSWIAGQGPVDLATSMLGHASVPSARDRRKATELMCRSAGFGDARILEGLFLRRSGALLALVEAGERAVAVHSEGVVVPVAFPEASGWRRLAWAAASLSGIER